MFDSTFERSKLYFTVLQTLRIFTEWIQESEREVQQLKRDFDLNIQSHTSRHGSTASSCVSSPPDNFMNEIDEAWDELVNMHGSSSKYLLDRIEKKEVEIKSFRDGVRSDHPHHVAKEGLANNIIQLFSATSVREASRATVLNQYIFVFTVVTIFYLPLSYVSVRHPILSRNHSSNLNSSHCSVWIYSTMTVFVAVKLHSSL